MIKKSRLEKLKKVIGGMGIAAVMSMGFASDVFAQEEVTKHHDVKVNIKSGGLHLETSDVIPFEDIVIEKERKSYYTSFKDNKVTVADLRGGLYGWMLTVQAEPLTMYDEDEYSFSLPEGSLMLKEAVEYGYYWDGQYFSGDDDPYYSYEPGDKVIDDGEVVIAKGMDRGLFDIYYPDDALELTIDPTTALEGEYETTLIWTLYPYNPYEDIIA